MKLYKLFLGSLALIGSAQLYGSTDTTIRNLSSSSIRGIWTASGGIVCAGTDGSYDFVCHAKTITGAGGEEFHSFGSDRSKLKLHVVDSSDKKWVFESPADGGVYIFSYAADNMFMPA